MNRINHTFRIRETCRIKLMASPWISFPVLPVHDNIIHTHFTFSELTQGRQYLILRFIPFTALPKAHRPSRHDRRFTGDIPIAWDYLVHRITMNKIIIYIISHLRPHRQSPYFFFRTRRQYFQPNIRAGSLTPFDTHRDFLSRLQIGREFHAIRIPRGPPTFFYHQFIIQEDFRIRSIE